MNPYKGYRGSVVFDEDEMVFSGTVQCARDVIHYQATSAEDLVKAFRDSVDDYLDWCAEDGVAPAKPYSGKLAFRTSPEHHQLISEAASASAKSINQWMDEALAAAARETLSNGITQVKLR